MMSCHSESRISPAALTCEYLKNPPVIDVANPRLSWINKAKPGERGKPRLHGRSRFLARRRDFSVGRLNYGVREKLSPVSLLMFPMEGKNLIPVRNAGGR